VHELLMVRSSIDEQSSLYSNTALQLMWQYVAYMTTSRWLRKQRVSCVRDCEWRHPVLSFN